MENYPDFQEMPDYVSIKEAARIIGVSANRVYEYVTEGRLKGLWAADVIMIPLEEAKNFKRGATGRPRKNTPAWRISAAEDTQFTLSILVPLRAGKFDALLAKLEAMRRAGQYIFPGTVARYIVDVDGKHEQIEITFIWRKSTMPDESAREHELQQLREALQDVLDWEKAQYHHNGVLMHT